MTTPSKVTSPRRTRKTPPPKVSYATGRPRPRCKTKTAALPEPTCITPRMTREQEWKAYHIFVGNLTPAEMKVVGRLIPLDFPTPLHVVREAKRLLGESIAQCKLIPFPVGGKRGIQLAKEA